MNKRMLFLWIDDEPGREKTALNFEKSAKIKIKFVPVKDRDLLQELKDIKDDNFDPDLILIDHKLDKVVGHLVETGSTAAEILREKWNECPILCVTAMDIKDIPLHRKAIYEDIIASNKFSEHYSLLMAIAKSYKIMKKKKPKDVSAVIKLLLAPEEDRVRLKAIMPEELKGHLNDESLLINISKWVRFVLISRPGFLFDSLWMATLLGIKETSFTKIKKIFREAKYTGIFSDESNQRWWQSRTRAILFSKGEDINSKLPWELGRALPQITKKDYSVCYVCDREFPETVAYTDSLSTKREPMHLRCTVSHPNFESSLFFEEIRMMKTAK